MFNYFSQAKCEHCGNNPTPHFFAWYFESMSCLLEGFRRAVSSSKITSIFLKTLTWLKITEIVIWFFSFVKIIKLNPNRKSCKISRAKVLWEEAEKRGIAMQEIFLFGKSLDCYVAKKVDSKTIFFSGLPRIPNVVSPNFEIMDDKAELKKLFIKNGLPVPLGGSCRNLGQALEIFQKIEKPVIVKPRLGSRGRHSTTFINTAEELKEAFRVAKQLCYWVVVEEQLEGPVYRATLIDFKLGGVLRGDAPEIVGDGTSSIQQLIKTKNSQPHLGVKDIIVSLELENFLKRQSLNLKSVPKFDEKIVLLSRIGVNYGGSSAEEFEICHPDTKELFVRAAKVLGDQIVGFDFIIPDITCSYKEQKCGFIEANSLPFINLHHEPFLGEPRNVAAMVWEMVGW